MFEKIKEKHGAFYSTLWYLSFVLGSLYAVFSFIQNLFFTAREGNFAGFVLLIVFQSIFFLINTFWVGLVIFLGLSIVLTIPYLIYRGFKA